MRKSRYVGRRRTLWQLALAAAVVNLMLIASNERAQRGEQASFWLPLWRWYLTILENIARHRLIRAYGLSYCLFLKRALRTKAFRPSF